MKELIEEALRNKKNNDVELFVWKGKKIRTESGKVIQEEKRLVDASESELRSYYQHCNSMLYNQSKDDPGRYPLLDIIKDQRNRCNCELFLRWLETGTKKPRYVFMSETRAILDEHKVSNAEGVLLEDIYEGMPEDYAKLPIDLIMDGCLDKLGKFYKKHITLTFILKQGIWFTPEETKDLTEKDDKGKDRNRLEVVKERVGLDQDTVLHTTPKGLSFSEFRAMVRLRSNKYSDLSGKQLETLRDKMLFELEDDVKFHIRQWEERKAQIMMVAELNGISLD